MKLRWYVAGLLAAAVTLTACSSAKPPPKAASSRVSTTAGFSTSKLNALKATLDKYLAVPTFVPPGPTLTPSKYRGKTILTIPDSSSNPFTEGVDAAMQQAATAAGVHLIVCTNQGQVAQWISCFNQGITEHVNIIDDYGGVDPQELEPQIHAAEQAGITVAAENVYGFSQQPGDGIKYSIPTPYEEAGKLMADYAVMDTKGKADALVVTSNEVLATAPIVAGIKQVFATECPTTCKLTFVNAPVADWATQITGDVQSALQAHPNMNYVIPIYDSMTQYVIPGIIGAGRTGKTFVSTFNGTPSILRYIETGNIVRMDLGEDPEWIGWAFMDADLRLLSGIALPSVFNEHTPLRMFTKTNVSDTGTPPVAGVGYGNSYINDYKKLWGLS